MTQKTGLLLLVLTIFFSTACTSLFKQSKVVPAHNNTISIEKLLDQLPADGAVEQQLIIQALFQKGSAGISETCRWLTKGKDRETAARFALNGLAVYISKERSPEKSNVFLSGIQQSWPLPFSDNQRVFLLDQIGLCGDEKALPFLVKATNNPKLARPALRALQSIGGPQAGGFILKQLEKADDSTRPDLLLALVNLEYQPAEKTMLAFADHKNKAIRSAAVLGLSRLGQPSAIPVLQHEAKANASFLQDYAVFIRKLAGNGKKADAAELCREILRNEEKLFSGVQRRTVLSLLSEIDPVQAADALQKVFKEDDKKMRMAALNTASELQNNIADDFFREQIKTVSAERQVEIIDYYGRSKNPQFSDTIIPFVNSDFPTVRSAAIKALCLLNPERAVAEMINYLKTDLEETEIIQVNQLLLTMPGEQFVPQFVNNFASFSTGARVLFLDILAQRSQSDQLTFIASRVAAENTEVRIAALNALKVLAPADQLDYVLEQFNSARSVSEEKAFTDALSAIVRKQKHSRDSIEKLIRAYNHSGPEHKTAFYGQFKRLGGKQLVNHLSAELGENRGEQRDRLIRTLAGWPDASALQTLLNLSHPRETEVHRILATRAALRILRENELGDQRELEYYQEIMEKAFRPEEQKLALAGLSDLKTPGALRYLAGFLSNPELDMEAWSAISNMIKKKEDGAYPIPADEAAAALIEGRAGKELLAKIRENKKANSTLNKAPEGFSTLFNGENLDGWKGLVENPPKRMAMSAAELAEAQATADQEMRDHWKVIDGVLYFDGRGHSLCTAKDYTDFEMLIDWKIEKHGDSGIYLRGAPQVQIWDPAKWPEGSGALYNNLENPRSPLLPADNPIGEWNTFRIIMRGERVTVYLNGKQVVNNVIMENYWERNKPIYRTGQIELQSHNSLLYFRNIFIRELPEEEAPFDGNLFNGQNLKGWQVVNNSTESWKVKDGILFTEGEGGGWLSTDREYGDFQLELEFRVPEGGNSGIFLRAPLQGNPAYAGMEVQVLDDYAQMYEKLKPWQYTGSIYGLQAPAKRVTKQAGQWQKMEISCMATQVVVKLNGVEINNADLLDFMDREEKHPGIKRRKGFIGLQNHSTKIEYRNIRLKEFK